MKLAAAAALLDASPKSCTTSKGVEWVAAVSSDASTRHAVAAGWLAIAVTCRAFE